jgi:predicted RecA/RadA family phage recombinase
MTSPDGINWTIRTSAADNDWRAVTYGNGLFVAVARTGTGNRVMTSPDGINWTIRTSAADNDWRALTYGNGLFVAVAASGIGNRVMTSPDGITWTIRTSAADNAWRGITYGNGLFVAVTWSGTGNRVMTSPDGINWTIRTSAADNAWHSVTYGNGLFVAVATTGTGNRVMTSPDGINWTIRTSAADNSWHSVTYGNGVFVAIANSGIGNRIMTSGKTDSIPFSANNIYQGGMSIMGGNVGIGMTAPTHQLQLSTDSAAKPSTNTWTIVSDMRVKRDIRPYQDGLEIIRQINPVWYKYSGLGGFIADDKDHIGIIGQDIADVAPYTVGTFRAKLNPNDQEETELLNFNSHALTFALINAVKKLDQRIENIKEEFLTWLSDKTLRVRRLFVQDELCIGQTCLNEAQIRAILEHIETKPTVVPQDQTPAMPTEQTETGIIEQTESP